MGNKLVNIWRLGGSFIVGGVMSYSTYIGFVQDNDGDKEAAREIWDDACTFSSPEYARNIRVTVQKLC